MGLLSEAQLSFVQSDSHEATIGRHIEHRRVWLDLSERTIMSMARSIETVHVTRDQHLEPSSQNSTKYILAAS